MINNNYRQFAIDDFYTQQTIEQYTDKLANQTSFCLHLHNAYNLVQRCQVNQLIELKCKYCKAFYFPTTINKKNNDSMQVKKQTLKKIIETNEQVKTYACELCGSINDISKAGNFINKFPEFHQPTTRQKDIHYNSHFQSVIVSQTKPNNETVTKIKPLIKVQNEIIFVFCIDLDMLSQTIQLNNLTYFKTVVMEFFGRHIQKTSCQNDQQHQQDQQHSFIRQKQNYRLLLTFSMNDQFFVADLNTISTICVDTLLKERVFSTVPSEKTQQMVQKQNQRKENLIELLHKSSVKIDSQESLRLFQQYMGMLIEERNQSNNKMRLSVNGSANYTKLMQLLSCDKSPCHSYVISWLSSTPVLNYEPHRVKKGNIYSFIYLFCQKPIENQNKEASKLLFLGEGKFQHANVRNELLLVKDNNEVRFINVYEHQESYQFYYLLYELFAIVDSPKMLRPKWVIKTDSKYPPILTNDPPSFFIKIPVMLYFIVSSLIDKGGHSKFQVSVQFEDWRKDEHVWIINWTKDSQKQSLQLKGNSHKQIQVIPKMSQICNYIHILVKYMMNASIRGKTDIAEGKRHKLMSLNTVTGHQFSIIIESIINHGVFRANNIEIGIQYLSRLYQYLSQFKGIPFEVLRFLSCCQYNIRRAMLMLFPLVVSSFEEQSCLVYWSGGYVMVSDDDGEGQDGMVEGWCEDTMEVINQRYEGKYFTKRFLFNNHHNHHQKYLSHQEFIAASYLTKAGILQPQIQHQRNHNLSSDSQLGNHQNHNKNQAQSKNPYKLIDRSLATSIKVYVQNDSEQNSY